MTAALSPDLTLTPAEVTRAVVSAAFSVIDPAAAAKVTHEGHWRNNFSRHLTTLDTAIAREPSTYPTVAAEGLRAAHELFTATRGPGAGAGTPALGTTVLRGGTEPHQTLQFPYRGKLLRGAQLITEVESWAARGICTDSVPASIKEIDANPQWLSLPGRTIVILGAMAKIGPFWPLLRWGASVAAIDLPHPKLATALQFRARESAGTAVMPVGASGIPGADICAASDAIVEWICGLGGDLVIVNTLRGPEGDQFHTAMAADALIQQVLVRRPGTVIADLASPADSFAVHAADIEASRESYEGSSRRLKRLARTMTRGHAMQPNFPKSDTSGVVDAHMPQHTWDFTMAKRISRWRAVEAAHRGITVSHNIAPATYSKPMQSQTLSQMVVRSAARFGIEPFEERAAATVMAALLAYDLCADPAPAPDPVEAEYNNAVHGGLWTSPYQPRSVIGLVGGTQPTGDTLDITNS